jgi:hypothetical protein
MGGWPARHANTTTGRSFLHANDNRFSSFFEIRRPNRTTVIL